MKNLTLFILALLTMTVITGCKTGPSADSPTTHPVPEKEPIEITIITSYGVDDGNRQSYEKALKAYESASGNIIRDISSVSSEEWKAQVMARFENGTEPDILFYFTGIDSDKIIAENKVVSIEEIRSVYPDYASNMNDSMLAKSFVDGKSYGVPVNGYWEGLFVNKKVLADCGVKIPDADTTWEQFLADCQKIADKGYIPIAASLMEVPHYWFEFCVLNNGSIESHSKLPLSSDDVIGQIWIAGLNDIKTLYANGFFPRDTTTITSAEADVLMTENKAAFLIDGSWKLGWFAENAADIDDFTVTYVPGKGSRKSTDMIAGLSMGYFITRAAWDNPEKRTACIEFVSAVTSDEVVATFGTTAVTALKNGIIPPPDANNLIKDALAMTNNVTGAVSAAGDNLFQKSRLELFNSVKDIVTGRITAAETIERCLAIKN